MHVRMLHQSHVLARPAGLTWLGVTGLPRFAYQHLGEPERQALLSHPPGPDKQERLR